MNDNKVFDMDECFKIEYVRKKLIDKLKEEGVSDEEIERIISMCDEMYKEHKFPYPTIDEVCNQ